MLLYFFSSLICCDVVQKFSTSLVCSRAHASSPKHKQEPRNNNNNSNIGNNHNSDGSRKRTYIYIAIVLSVLGERGTQKKKKKKKTETNYQLRAENYRLKRMKRHKCVSGEYGMAQAQ